MNEVVWESNERGIERSLQVHQIATIGHSSAANHTINSHHHNHNHHPLAANQHHSPQVHQHNHNQSTLPTTMIAANGQNSAEMMAQSANMVNARQQQHNNNNSHNQNSIRSQDDAMVGYFFQRPQTDPDFQNYQKQSRWALGDDSVLEVRQNDAELEKEFQNLTLDNDGFAASTKKIWGIEDHGISNQHDDGKGLFLEPNWRDTTWSTAGHANPSEHAVSQPIMVNRRSGSYPGSDAPSMLSPRSGDTGGLGVKMVEYVLGSSPTTKDLDGRMSSRVHILNEKHKKLKGGYDDKGKDDGGAIQTNGIIQNGLDDDAKGFNRTPGSHQSQGVSDEELAKSHGLVNDVSKLKPNDSLVPTGMHGMLPGHHFPDAFDHVNVDALQFGSDYTSHLMNSIDSPGILDYNSQMYQRANQAQGQMPAALIASHQQQYNLAQQQGQGIQPHTNMAPNGTGTNPFPQNPYYQDPFAAQMGHIIPAGPPHPVMAQYYGMPPWGVYPPGLIQSGQGQPGAPPHIQQQQQQMMRGNGARPLTPQGPNDSSTNPQAMQGQYPMMPAHGYYDQNGSIMMGNAGTRGMNAMRIMPQMIMNPHAGQSGNNNLRMMAGGQSGQNHSGPPNALFSSNASNVANNALYTSTTNNSLGYSSSSGKDILLSSAKGNQLDLITNLGHNAQSQSYGNSTLGPIGASLTSGIGLGNSSPRRESFDGRREGLGGGMFSTSLDNNQFSRHLGNSHKNGQFYGLGPGITSPGPIGMLPPSQSLTPPPSLNGSTNNLNLNMMRGSLAPGADKYLMPRNQNYGASMFGSSNPNSAFPNRALPRNSSLEKPTGRSRLLEDFRNNRYPNLQLRDLAEHIVEFSQDQHGSRFIQQKLERATPAEKQMVFNEILGSAYNLMTDVFGNYVIQKFFEFGTPEQKQALAQKVRGHVLQLALQMYGCRVIQKALESIPQDQQKDVVKELDGHVLKCVKDQNGNHVVQKCIECVEPVALQFIINAFQGQVFALSTHPYGCRVIQRILEHCTGEQTSPILEELHQHTEQLVQDQYGNYVVQHVLEHGRPEDKTKIIQMVRGKVLHLSQHKFASNVVERCVTHASRPERAVLIEEVCSYTDNTTHSALYTMMKDQYANYVVQKMIEVAEAPQRKLLLQRIRPHMPALRKYTYGKHILAKLEKYMMKNNELPIGATNGSL